MTLEELADLIRANGANTNGRIDQMRNESNATLMTIQNDLTDVRGDIAGIRRTLSRPSCPRCRSRSTSFRRKSRN